MGPNFLITGTRSIARFPFLEGLRHLGKTHNHRSRGESGGRRPLWESDYFVAKPN